MTSDSTGKLREPEPKIVPSPFHDEIECRVRPSPGWKRKLENVIESAAYYRACLEQHIIINQQPQLNLKE